MECIVTESCKLSISIVSHGQANLVKNLLKDIRTFSGQPFEVLLTFNITEDKTFIADFKDLPITLIENQHPKGFGDNHNTAFKCSRGDIFVVVNPDIRAPKLDLTSLTTLSEQQYVGACAPRVLNPMGTIEDSARRFPTFFRLVTRVLFIHRKPDYDLAGTTPVMVDWVAGMFVLFPRSAFEAVGGFDTRYFMYMEDADICRRLKQHGYLTLVDCSTSVVHDARRSSHRSLRHLSWHLRSAIRFLKKGFFCSSDLC